MAYDYIRKMYGFEAVVGKRVRHTETGRFGFIAREGRSHKHYVRVLFDHQKFAIHCHPDELEYVDPTSTQAGEVE